LTLTGASSLDLSVLVRFDNYAGHWPPQLRLRSSPWNRRSSLPVRH